MSSHIGSILYCISLFTGLPVAAPPTGGIITAQMSRLWAYYVPHSETIVIGAPDPDDWLLAHELTHYLQAHAGVPSDERQAIDAARHCSQATTRKENEIEDDVTDFGMTTEQLLDIDLREAGKNL